MAMESWVYLGGWSDLRLLYGKEVVSCSLILLEENVPAVVLLGVQPVDFVHLANDDKLIAVTPDGAVIVKAIRLLGITTDHMGGLHYCAGHRVVNTTAGTCLFTAWHVHDTLLSVVHHAHAFRHAL